MTTPGGGTAVDETPFLTVQQLVGLWRPLSTVEANAADLLLAAAARWIRERKPAIAADDTMAKVVSFEVVREAIQSGKYAGLRQFSRTIGLRMESGLLDEAAARLSFTPQHKEMLGISQAPRPRATKGDYSDPALPPNTIRQTRWPFR